VDKGRRIALVGNGATTRASDNFDGEIWTTASVAKILPRVDRIFEVHKQYDAAKLNGYNCPVMMDGMHADVARCQDLEISSLVAEFGPVFQFSFDYMMGLIASETGLDIEVTLYGIDLTTDSEYSQFRQSFFYWIGMLRGSGAKVTISQGSAIFNRRWVYCHESDEIELKAAKLAKLGQAKLGEWEQKEDEARLQVAFSNGFLQGIEEFRK
jgi:hypothetical protein